MATVFLGKEAVPLGTADVPPPRTWQKWRLRTGTAPTCSSKANTGSFVSKCQRATGHQDFTSVRTAEQHTQSPRTLAGTQCHTRAQKPQGCGPETRACRLAQQLATPHDASSVGPRLPHQFPHLLPRSQPSGLRKPSCSSALVSLQRWLWGQPTCPDRDQPFSVAEGPLSHGPLDPQTYLFKGQSWERLCARQGWSLYFLKTLTIA